MGDDEQVSLYQIWDSTNWYRGTLTNPNPKYIQIALSHKYKTKEPKVHKYQIRIPNIKCELRTNQRESHKANPKVATYQERVNH